MLHRVALSWVELCWVSVGFWQKPIFAQSIKERSNITFFATLCIFLCLLFYMVMLVTTATRTEGGLAMTLFDSAWHCLTLFDFVWLCFTLFDSVWLFGVGHVATMSNLNPSYIELLWVELSYVEFGLGFDKSLFLHKVL